MDMKKTQQMVKEFDREVNGRGDTQDLKNMSGRKPDKASQQPPDKNKHPNTAFMGQKPLGDRSRSRTIALRNKKKEERSPSTAFPHTFTNRIEKPPDGLFKTKNIQSIPTRPKDETPIMLHAPPLRIGNQKRFPIGKAATEKAWKQLISGGGAKTTNVATSAIDELEVEKSAARASKAQKTAVKSASSNAFQAGQSKGQAVGFAQGQASVQSGSSKRGAPATPVPPALVTPGAPAPPKLVPPGAPAPTPPSPASKPVASRTWSGGASKPSASGAAPKKKVKVMPKKPADKPLL